MLLTGPFAVLSMPSFDFHLPPCDGRLPHPPLPTMAIATLAIATVSLGGTISLCIGGWLKSLTRIEGPGSPGTSGVKNVKQCSRNTKLGQKNRWSKLNMMMTFTEVKGSSQVKCGKLCAMATKLGQKNPWCEFIMMITFMEVKGHQRSNVVNYVLWLPNLVRRIPDASLWWWWPSWRSNSVIRGQMRFGKLCAMATKLWRNPGASLWWWWPSWRSKVIRG